MISTKSQNSSFKQLTWDWVGDCKIITSHKGNENGYVQMSVKGRGVYLHRLVYATHNGPIPKGMVVMHKCNNTKCFNLQHLLLGTQQENMAQMVREKRGHGGTGVKQLTDRQAWMVKYHHPELKAWEVAELYPASIRTIRRIRRGDHYPYILRCSFSTKETSK